MEDSDRAGGFEITGGMEFSGYVMFNAEERELCDGASLPGPTFLGPGCRSKHRDTLPSSNIERDTVLWRGPGGRRNEGTPLLAAAVLFEKPQHHEYWPCFSAMLYKGFIASEMALQPPAAT